MTIRLKLICWYSGLLAAIIVVFGLTMFAVTRWVMVSSVDTTLQETVDQVWRNSNAALMGEFGAPSSIMIQLPELDVFRASSVVVQVWDMSTDSPGLIRASSNLHSYHHALDQAMLMQQAAYDITPGSAPVFYSDARLNDRQWRVLTRPIDVWGIRLVIQTATSMETVNQAGRGILLMIGGGMVVALVGSAIFGMYLSHRALKPITAITRAAAHIAEADDLKTRLNWNGPMDELGQLTSVFNKMMERLQHLFSVQQRFIGDVSHELRTPLTAIRGNLDIVRRYGMDDQSLEAIESEAERMERMVNDLLLLAKADYGGLTLTLMPLDLDEVVTEVYRQTRALTKDRNLVVTIRDFEPVKVNGDIDRLKQLLLNLLTNAIKFTPDGGTITMNLRRDPRHAILEVVDTGIGIAPADQKRVYDRFFQADTARERGGVKGEGTGLGLSIAKWITEAHDGKIALDSEVGIGTTFTVTLPHLESETPVSPTAVTRPRLNLIRRALPE